MEIEEEEDENSLSPGGVAIVLGFGVA